MKVRICPEETKALYYIANIDQDRKEEVKCMLEAFRVSYYIPSEDPSLSCTLRYLFQLPELINLIWLPACSLPFLKERSATFPATFYYQSEHKISAITSKEYELFLFVIHREVPGLIINATQFEKRRKIRIRVTDGMFKGFEGFLPVDPRDGYALVLEIPPLFSWQLPVGKHEIQVIPVRRNSSFNC